MLIIVALSVFYQIGVAYAQTTITGVVSDKNTGEALPFTQIKNVSSDKTVETDLQGRFSIEAIEGKDSLIVYQSSYEKLVVLASNGSQIRLNPSIISLNGVIVSADREYQKRSTAPISISTISARTIEDNKPTTIDQVLNQQPGINMVDLGNEQHTMSIRTPINYNATFLYLEDGVPIRSSGIFNHNSLLEMNMANVNNIEIIRGPASSFYGSEAIGGAINFITKKPSVTPTFGVSMQANTIGYKRTDFYVSNTFGKKFGVRLAGYYANKKGGPVAFTDFNKLALSLDASYYINKKNDLTLSTTMVNYDSDMSGTLDSVKFYRKSYESNQTFTYRKVQAFRTKLAYTHEWNAKSKTTLTTYYRNNSIKQNPSYYISNDYNPYSKKGDPNLAHGQVNNNAFQSYGLIAQHKQDFSFLNSQLIVGATIDYSPNSYYASYIRIHKTNAGIYDSFASTDSSLANYQANLLNVAGYAQYKIEPVKNLIISAALRFDDFNYDFKNNLDSNAYSAILNGKNVFMRVTPKIGITYDFKKNRGIYANYSQGFVPPQVTTLYVGYKVPSLKPIYYSSYEIGGWYVLAKGRIKLEASLYRMDGLNEILNVLQPNGTTQSQNAGKTTHQGVEYGITAVPHRDLKIVISGTNSIHKFLSYTESGIDYSRKRMALAPNWIANVVVIYKPHYFKGFRISAEWRHVGPYFMDNQNTQKYTGYDIFNIRTGYEIKGFEVWVNIINVTNKLYSTVTQATAYGQQYILGSPINVNIGIGYKFQQNKNKKHEK